MKNDNYKNFILMLIISFVIMYSVMFLNVASIDHIYLSLTRFYMTLLMVSPMAVLMLFMMKHMYTNKRLNNIIILSSLIVFVLALIFLRTQTFISDEQYLAAMISHHSSAILTSENAELVNPLVINLSEQIIQAQEYEIELMKTLLNQ